MKKMMAVFLALAMLMAGVAAFGEEASQQETPRNLVVYFSVAENSEVDAVSSASVMEWDGETVGIISVLANMIHQQVGGDLYSIDTAVEYPSTTIIDFAAEEQDRNDRPELLNHIENLDDYDTIYIGYPIWWYDLPMAMYSFFDEYDFSGKTIVPFCTHNGSRFSGTIQTIQELEPDATVIEDGFTVNERDVGDAQQDVLTWLEDLNLEFNAE